MPLALACLAIAAAGARGEIQIAPPGAAADAPPMIEQPMPSVLGGILLLPEVPPVAVPEAILPLPDPGALARKARREADCMRLSKKGRGVCLGLRRVPQPDHGR